MQGKQCDVKTHTEMLRGCNGAASRSALHHHFVALYHMYEILIIAAATTTEFATASLHTRAPVQRMPQAAFHIPFVVVFRRPHECRMDDLAQQLVVWVKEPLKVW